MSLYVIILILYFAGIYRVCFAVAWLLCSHSSAIPVVNLQDDGTFSANSYAMNRSF